MALSRLRLAAAAATVVITTGLVVVIGQTPAVACIADDDGDCYRSVTGTVTATAGLNLRAAPWGTVLDTVPYNYSNTVDCYVQASDGSYWDWLYDTRIGRSGWVYDPYLYTGGNIYQQVDEMTEGSCGQWPLTIPSNVRATAISSGAIRVTWTDTNGGGANYVISNGNVSSANLPGGTTSYTWGGLAPNTYMCFTVAAKANGGQSPWTPYACATTWQLTTPTNVRAVATSGSVVHVSWTDTTGGGAQFVVTNGNGPSPNLAAGTTGYDWTGITPGTYMCFAVAAKQSGAQSAWSPYACTTTGTYVNLGDSFSSGEGSYTPPAYQAGSDTSTDKCHRSDKSYSGQFAAMSAHWNHVTVNIACSGAVTNDIVNPISGANNEMNIPAAGEPAQISKLNTGTGLVTFTIGGNNLNLAGIFTTCMMKLDHDQTDSCFTNDYFNDTFINNIPAMLNGGNGYGPGLLDTYKAIQAAAPNAHIVVSTYPEIFPRTYTGDYREAVIFPVTWLYVITSQNQLDRIHRVMDALNNAIKSAAAQVGFTVRDEQGLFSGHEIGSSSPWVNDVQGFSITNQNANDESLHPNQTGYQHWASDLQAALG